MKGLRWKQSKETLCVRELSVEDFCVLPEQSRLQSGLALFFPCKFPLLVPCTELRLPGFRCREWSYRFT